MNSHHFTTSNVCARSKASSPVHVSSWWTDCFCTNCTVSKNEKLSGSSSRLLRYVTAVRVSSKYPPKTWPGRSVCRKMSRQPLCRSISCRVGTCAVIQGWILLTCVHPWWSAWLGYSLQSAFHFSLGSEMPFHRWLSSVRCPDWN